MSNSALTPDRRRPRHLHRRGRRRGVTLVYVTLMLFTFIGFAAYALDMSYLYQCKAQCQRACDAAALAGAFEKANFRSNNAFNQSYAYAAKVENGKYINGTAGCVVKCAPSATDPYLKNEQGVPQETWYRVDISRPEKTFFGQIFGIKSVKVGAYATALYETLQEIPIKGLGTYGVAPGPVNLSLFGPDGYFNNGDYLSVKKTITGATNTYYTGKGYDFTVKIPAGMGQSWVEIFDPDCFNAGDVADAAAGVRVDEYRTSTGGAGNYSNATKTVYTLYQDNGTQDPSDDTQIGQVTYGATKSADQAVDMTWVKAFNFNRDLYGANVQFRLNVTSTAGSSENGFDLRAGPSRSGSTAFDPNNGTSISAQGHIPMNFNTSGTVTISLGSAPKEAAGGTMTVRKFDTDVGATAITYTCSALPGWSTPGTLSGNGTFATDTFTIPNSYYTSGPGTWMATYTAGLGDTSVWDMTYSNGGQGKPGPIKLVR